MRKKLFFSLLKFFVGLFLIFIFLIGGVFLYFAKDLPRPEIFWEKEFFQSTKIFDKSGKILLYEIFEEEKRTFVPLEKIPKYLQDAVVAVEDSNFYSHFGVDFKAVLRAILEDLKIQKPVYGASTIPQQLVRSSFLGLEKSLARKTREVILAIELDFKYSKNQILEWYLNQIPFGQNAYGVEAASQIYFGKSVSEISLPEAATLAALIKAPYRFSPYSEEGKKELLKRKDYVLERMLKLGFISEKDANEAKKQEIVFKEKKKDFFAPHFVLWIKSILEEKYGKDYLKRAGLKVYTSLDVEAQKIAEKVVKEGIEKNKKFGAFNACLVALDPRNGEVLAMAIGTSNYDDDPFPKGCIPGKDCKFDPKVNVCFAKRQPGSAFKPFVYAAAFNKGYSDDFLVLDELTNFGIWGGKEYLPQNYDEKFRGWVSLREALAQSLNIPSIKVLYLIGFPEKLEKLEILDFRGKENYLLEGLKESIELAKNFGISSLNKPISEYGPSLVLGGGEVTPFEMALAFSVFANSGFRIYPNPILKIEDKDGKVIFEAKENKTRVIKSEVAEKINSVLSDNEARAPIFGLRSPLYFEHFKVAAKTGTTQNFRDAWTIGYVPSLVVSVWVGNNDNSPILKKPGVVVAAPIWHNFLKEILPKKELNSF